jgi:hypothetical protein
MNRTLQLCGLKSATETAALCAKHFGTGIRGKHVPTVQKTDPKIVTRAIQMKAEGRRVRDIAKELGKAASTISYILNGRGK